MKRMVNSRSRNCKRCIRVLMCRDEDKEMEVEKEVEVEVEEEEKVEVMLVSSEE